MANVVLPSLSACPVERKSAPMARTRGDIRALSEDVRLIVMTEHIVTTDSRVPAGVIAHRLSRAAVAAAAAEVVTQQATTQLRAVSAAARPPDTARNRLEGRLQRLGGRTGETVGGRM